jgi:uridine monophosphate synthetase
MASPELMKKLYDIGAIKFGEFILKSGKKSPYYIDLRILPSYPSVLVEVGKAIGEMIRNSPKRPTRLCGIPATGLAIATVIGIETGIPVCFTRKEPIIYKDLATQLSAFVKEGRYRPNEILGVEKAIETINELSGLKTHGIMRYVDGDIQDGDIIGIVDDLITTAQSKLEARDLILLETKRRNIRVEINDVYVLLDREQGGRETLEKEGFRLYAVTTITEVVKQLYDLKALDFERYKTIMNYVTAEKQVIRG